MRLLKSRTKINQCDTRWIPGDTNKKDFMIPADVSKPVSENENSGNDVNSCRITLGKFERSKILQVYFARLDGRSPEEIPVEFQELYTIDLPIIKSFLLNQHPQDALLLKIFKMMS